jgi:hypothetical protein
MRNPLRISNEFRIKQKILEILYEDWQETGIEGRQVGSIKIAEVTNIPIAQINRWHQSLIAADEITTVNNDGHFMMTITPKGRASYVDQNYLRKGRNEYWDGIWNWARMAIPMGALILSLITFLKNRELTNRVKDLEIQIQQLKKK